MAIEKMISPIKINLHLDSHIHSRGWNDFGKLICSDFGI